MPNFTLAHTLVKAHTFLLVCVCLSASYRVEAASDKANFVVAGGAEKASAEEDSANEAMRQTLNLNFSPKVRDKLRKALDDYAKSVDQDHDRIEERRRAMKASVEARFLDADNDNDGTIDRQEATEKLPQIARLFSQVDTNQDGVISLEELAEAQARASERRKAAENDVEDNKSQATEEGVAAKSKNKQVANTPKKRTY